MYKDDLSKEKIIDTIRSNQLFPKMIDYVQRSILLAPKDASRLQKAYGLFYFLRMDDEIKALANRAKAIAVETQRSANEIIEYRSGSKDAEKIASLKKSLIWYDEQLNGLDASHKFERFVTHSYRDQTSLSFLSYDKKIDTTKIFKASKARYDARLCSATISDYEDALVADIVQSARLESADFASYYDANYRTYDLKTLLMLSALQIPKFKEALLKLDSVKRLADLTEQSIQLFSSSPTVDDWLVLKTLGRPSAVELAERYQADAMAEVKLDLLKSYNANEEAMMVIEILHHLASGDALTAQGIEKEALDRGLSLPGPIASLF